MQGGTGKFITVYSTWPSEMEAVDMGRLLVEKKLAACANILPGLLSVFRWEGRVEETREAALLLKTRAALFAELCEAMVKAHPYALPCVVAWPMESAHAPFLDFIAAETGEGA